MAPLSLHYLTWHSTANSWKVIHKYYSRGRHLISNSWAASCERMRPAVTCVTTLRQASEVYSAKIYKATKTVDINFTEESSILGNLLIELLRLEKNGDFILHLSGGWNINKKLAKLQCCYQVEIVYASSFSERNKKFCVHWIIMILWMLSFACLLCVKYDSRWSVRFFIDLRADSSAWEAPLEMEEIWKRNETKRNKTKQKEIWKLNAICENLGPKFMKRVSSHF